MARIMEPMDEAEAQARREGRPVFFEPLDEVEYAEKHPEYQMMRSNDRWTWDCTVIAIVGVIVITAIIYFGFKL